VKRAHPPHTGFDAAPTVGGHYCPQDMADFECRHGRLPGDVRTKACGCWGAQDRGLRA
jgi:hypothetical protein